MQLIDPTTGVATDLPGTALELAADGQIERRDLSGESSGAAGAHGGWKPWRLSGLALVDRDAPAGVAVLRRLFYAADAAGEPVVYEVTGSALCEALGIRRVRFTEHLRVDEAEASRAWRLAFTLEEVDAVPERREQRETLAEAPAGTPAADLAGAVSEAMAAVERGDVGAAKSALERLLAFLDELAGRYLYGAG